MRTLGIIAEYNPFHNGHKLHIQTAKRELDADYCVVVMSGNFVQRGEPALIHKWKRAEMCLRGGADLVLELPVYYSTASAEYFAEGAVNLMDASNIVDYLSFGTESGTLEDFKAAAGYIAAETPEYKALLKSILSSGVSFPKARAKALAELANIPPESYETPNNILAIEYIKALNKINSRIVPHTVTRNTEHSSDSLGERFSSASAIRKAILSGGLGKTECLVPRETFEILNNSHSFADIDDYSDMLVYKIKTESPDWLRGIFDVSEGIENRITAAADNATIRSIITQTKTKRYTFTKIQRILTHILLDITTNDMETFSLSGGPAYIRVLGFARAAEPLLKRLCENASLPVIINLKKDVERLDEIPRKMLEKEIYASDIYFTKTGERAHRRKGAEYTIPIVCV